MSWACTYLHRLSARQDPIGDLARDAVAVGHVSPDGAEGWRAFLLAELHIINPISKEKVAERLAEHLAAAERLCRRWRANPDKPRSGAMAREARPVFSRVAAGLAAGADLGERCALIRAETLRQWERRGWVERSGTVGGRGRRGRRACHLTAAGAAAAKIGDIRFA